MTISSAIKAKYAEHFSADPLLSRTPEPSYFYSPELFALEQRDIFQRNWLYFCHSSQLPNPGDYLTGEIAGQSIYVVRGSDGTLRGFFNVCRHRGHQLLKGQGNIAGLIRCPYHSWTYDLEGALKHAPRCDQVLGFDKSAVSLSAIGLHVAAGFVFVNLDPKAPAFADCLGDLEQRLLAMVPAAESLKLACRQNFSIKANWKVVAENFLENYHSFYSGPGHRQLSDIIDQSTYRVIIDGRLIEFSGRGGDAECIPYQLGNRSISPRREGFVIQFVWPNAAFILLPGADILLVFLMNSIGPEETAEPLLYFTTDGTVDPVSRSAVDWFNETLGPEDVELCENVQRGLHSLGYESGRLMVDRSGSDLWSERILHHFNTLNLEAIRSA
jgi:phenylpropionate dioxygenase-like ring-hydroxylating dioxygenase large terminal subunit